MASTKQFKINCKQCKRLVSFLKSIKKQYPDYYCKPVPSFGDPDAQLLIVGLAPGMHGANASGRAFTGDASGILLYQTLYNYGFASADKSVSIDDGLQLLNCRITNAVKCLPPQNKPTGDEINTCNQYLSVEISQLPDNAIIVALGSIAHNAVLKAMQQPLSAYKFAHDSEYVFQTSNGKRTLISSYHCSKYNTQTRRLTVPMFEKIFAKAKQRLANE